MATVRILLGFVWLIAIGSGWSIERNPIANGITYQNKNYGGLLNNDDGANQRIVAAAKKETGVREGDVPNSGQKVSVYLRYVGISYPAPWCAAFVSYVFGQAGYTAPKTAWSPDLFPAQRSVKEPKPGLVLGIYYPALKRIAHCGIVYQVKNELVYSIEGNTNVNGSREGDGVYRRVRHLRSIYRFADWCRKK